MNEQNLIVKETEGKGRGVFAKIDFAQGELIECAPIIKIPDPQWQLLENTSLKEYYFNWSDDAAAIALGYIEMYNYDEHPNARTVRLQDRDEMEIVALSKISVGEEITIRYQCEPWFTVLP